MATLGAAGLGVPAMSVAGMFEGGRNVRWGVGRVGSEGRGCVGER